MYQALESVFPPVFAVTAVLYIGLATLVLRSSPHNVIGFFLFLLGTMVAGSALSIGATDPNMFGIGRTLSIFAGGFLPVAFYAIYRQYSGSAPGSLMLAILSVVPVMTTLLALTNSMHGLVWTAAVTEGGIYFAEATDDFWMSRVHFPFSYGLFGFSVIALISRLPSIAPAHRRPVTILVSCAILPYLVGIASGFAGGGTQEFPLQPATVSLLLPVYAYASLSTRVYEFRPVVYETLFNHVRDPVIVLDNEQCVICLNRSATEMLDSSEDELMGRPLWEDFPEARLALRRAQEFDLTQTLRMDSEHTWEVTVEPLLDERGKVQGTVIVCRDVTQRRKALSRLADSEHLIRTLIETSSNGILRFSRDDSDERRLYRCIFANRAAEEYLNGDGGTLVGMPLDKLDQLEPARLLEHFGGKGRPGSPMSFETEYETAGSDRWLRIVCEPVGEDFSVTLIDITQRKHNENKMLADALRDPLTGILNRRGFEKEAATSIRGNERGAVLYLDLNQFKCINDHFGHQVGDALLKAFGHRLEFCLRPEDILGRLGGDEFAIVLPAVSVDDAKHVAERLVDAASEAYIIQGEEIRCDVSVGISLMPQHGEELWHLISVADRAMYDAKSASAGTAANDRAAYVEAAIAS